MDTTPLRDAYRAFLATRDEVAHRTEAAGGDPRPDEAVRR
jgi:hypothetical protein